MRTPWSQTHTAGRPRLQPPHNTTASCQDHRKGTLTTRHVAALTRAPLQLTTSKHACLLLLALGWQQRQQLVELTSRTGWAGLSPCTRSTGRAHRASCTRLSLGTWSTCRAHGSSHACTCIKREALTGATCCQRNAVSRLQTARTAMADALTDAVCSQDQSLVQRCLLRVLQLTRLSLSTGVSLCACRADRTRLSLGPHRTRLTLGTCAADHRCSRQAQQLKEGNSCCHRPRLDGRSMRLVRPLLCVPAVRWLWC